MKPFTLALASLDPDDVTEFRKVFGKVRNRLSGDWRLGQEEDAALSVIDVDSIYGHMDWLKLTGSGLRTAAFTSAQYVNESDLVLFKPLQADNLVEVLNAVAAEHGVPLADAAEAQQVVTSTVEPEPPAEPPAYQSWGEVEDAASIPGLADIAPGSRKKVVADEAASGQRVGSALPEDADQAQTGQDHASGAGSVASHADPDAGRDAGVQARAKPSATQPSVSESLPEPALPEDPDPATVRDCLLSEDLTEPMSLKFNGEVWHLDPNNDAYYGPAKLKSLADALDQPLSLLKPLGFATLESIRAGKDEAQPLARLRWYAGLTAQPGELDAGLDADARFKLARWPRIEREFPRHFRIATAMMKEAGTVAEVAAIAGADEGDVADFMNACHAIGLIEQVGGSVEGAERRGGMMSRIRNPLRR